MYLRICISEFAAVYLGISSNVSRNYSFTYIELFRYLYRNYSVINNVIFYMSIESVVTVFTLYDLFGVVVRALKVTVKVMSATPDMPEEYTSEVMCTVP